MVQKTTEQLWKEIAYFGPGGNSCGTEGERFRELYKDAPPDLRASLTQHMGDYYRRDEFVRTHAWAVPSMQGIEAIKKLVGNDTVLEIASGTGLWARLMQDAGIKVIPTDSYEGYHFTKDVEKFTNVHIANHRKAIRDFGYKANALMFCWPPYTDPMAAQALKMFKGNKLIYIGEGDGGCTGDDRFHNFIRRRWEEVDSVDIPQWYGLHDYMRLYIRAGSSRSSCQ